MALMMSTIALAGCTTSTGSSAVICTNLGPIGVELYPEEAPITVSNFVNLAESGYYDGVVFHRIMTDFMMQGGDPTGTGRGGAAHGGGTIPDEFHPSLRHDGPGILSMANAGANTGGSQFFITFAPTPWLDDKHSIFGKVTNGMDVVERVNAEAASQSGTPRIDVYMQTVIVGGSPLDCPPAEGVPDPVPAYACPVVGRQDHGSVAADAITPGILCITKGTDQVLVWARSNNAVEASIAWSLTGESGTALPDGWTASFASESAVITPGEAVHTMLTVTVPEGTNGSFPLELHTGESTTELTAHVDLRHDEITQEGSTVGLTYAGTCTRDGEAFDDGSFSTTLGSGQTIVGFDLGLIGLGESETTTIVIPAELGYGNQRGPCPGDDADLTFVVTIDSF